MNNITKTENNPVYDCIIIGAGISGISFAHYLHNIGKSVIILEEKERVGGQIQSFTSNADPNYWAELGAHTCYNSYTNLLSLVADCEYTHEIQILEKCKYVLYTNNRIKSVFSELSLIPMALNCSKIFFSPKNGKTVKEYFRPIIGASNYDRIFTNLFRAVISQNADEYPAEIFLKKRKNKIKEVARKFSFKRGLSSLIEHIIKKDKLSVYTNNKVTEIKKIDKDYKYRIKTNQGLYFNTQNIAFASDPQTASNLIKDIDQPISDLLKSISLFKTESVNVIISKEFLSIDKMAGIIPLSDDFLSVVTRDVVEHPNLRSFTFHFEKDKKSQEEKIKLICQVLNISENDILEYTFTSHILPALRTKHLNLDLQLKNKRIDENLFILGNYFHGLSLEDCVHRSVDEFERFNKQRH